MIHSDQHLNWLRSLERGDLIGLSYYNGIQPGIIQRVRKGNCNVWCWKESRPGGLYPYKQDVVENLPYEVDWIPVQEGQYNLPAKDCTIRLRYIKSRAYERLMPYPKDFISKETNKIINHVKERLF
tara:strand:+ start:708 stop:1085 length:378 start_codon:yes stop_codon:yes gene_type:complete